MEQVNTCMFCTDDEGPSVTVTIVSNNGISITICAECIVTLQETIESMARGAA